MAPTDFFDDDLVKQRDTTRRIKLGPGDEPPVPLSEPASDEAPIARPISDFNLTRMARHKQTVDAKTAMTAQELERLRSREQDLEREKRDLEEMRRKHEEYERGKREMIDRFNQSLVMLEKEELRAERLAEFMGATRKRFKMMQTELQDLNEESWPEGAIREELTRALSLVENARMEYNKAMSRLDAIQGEKAAAPPPSAVVFEDRPREPAEERSFFEWIKVGLAVSLPMILVVVVLTALVMVLRSAAII